MKNEMALVQSIIEHIRTNRLAKTPMLEDLAEAYANLCVEVNNRLLKCQEFLQKGMRSEAIYEASLAPALLEVVVVIQFQEFNRWRNICQELDLPIPPQILIDIVERLHSELPKEQELEPLLKQYRRAVHHGEIRDSMDILRKIIPLDANNKVWKENLAALEDEYYDSQLADMEDALEVNDLEALQRFYDDAIHPTRTLPFPVELLARVRRALLAEQSAELNVRAEQICNQMQQYIAEHQANLLRPLLAQWTSLNNNEAFEPKADQLAIVTQANAEVMAAEKEHAKALKNEKLLEDLRAVVSLELPDVKSIAAALEPLRFENIMIPEELQTRVDAAYLRVGRYQQKRKRMIFSFACVMGFLVLGGLSGVYWHFDNQNRMKIAISDIANCLEKQQFDTAEQLLKENLALYPSLMRHAEFLELQDQVTKAQATKQANLELYSKILQELQAIANNHYQERIPEIEDKLSKIKACDGISEEQYGKIVAWEKEYRRQLQGVKDIETRRIRELCLKGEDLLKLVEAASQRYLKENIEKVRKSQKALSECEGKIDLLSPNLQKQWKNILDEHNLVLLELEKDLVAQAELKKSYVSLKKQISESVEDLNLYGNLLERFAKDFPSSQEAVFYKRVVNNLELYNAVLALDDNDFRDISNDNVKRHRTVENILQKYHGTNKCIWLRDLEEWKRYVKSAEQIKSLTLSFGTDDLTKDLFKNLFEVSTVHYRVKGSQQWRTLFIPSVDSEGNPTQLYTRKDVRVGQNPIERYWLKEVFNSVDDNTGKRFEIVHSSKVFPSGGWTDEKYDIHPDDYRQLTTVGGTSSFVPPRVLLDKVCGEIGTQKNVEKYLVDRVQDVLLAAQNSSTYCPAYAALARYWISCLYHAVGKETKNPYQKVFRITEKWDCNFAWFDVNNGQVAIWRSKLSSDFGDVQDGLAKAFLERQNCFDLISYALSRQIRVAGMIDYNENEDLVIRESYVLAADAIRDIWILETGAAQPYFRKVGVRQQKTIDISDSILKQLKPGQLLFVPLVIDPAVERRYDAKKFIPASWPREK